MKLLKKKETQKKQPDCSHKNATDILVSAVSIYVVSVAARNFAKAYELIKTSKDIKKRTILHNLLRK